MEHKISKSKCEGDVHNYFAFFSYGTEHIIKGSTLEESSWLFVSAFF